MNQQRARQFGVAIALAILGLGGGASMRAWRIHHGVGIEKLNGDGSAFAGAKFSGQASSVWGKFLAALGMRAGRTFSTSDLVALLSGHERDAAAAAFFAEFQNDPRLMEIWEEYKNGGGDLDWLARKLSDSRAFTELLNRHVDDERFRDLASNLARELEATLALRQGQQNPTGDGLAMAGSARAYAAVKGAKGVDGKGPVAWAPPVLAMAGPQGTSAIRGSEGPERYAAPEDQDTRDRESKTQESKAGHVGHGEHEVAWKLKDTISHAGPDKDLVRFLESLFESMLKPDRDALISLCADQGVCDPLAACSTSERLWSACTASCRSNPRCTIQFPDERPGAPAACAEPQSTTCGAFCEREANRSNPACIERAAAALAGEINAACADATSHACRSVCSHNAPNPACMDAAVRALAANCADKPFGSPCRSGCRNAPADNEVCASAAEVRLAEYCSSGWTNECRNNCQSSPQSPTCAGALTAAVTAACTPGSALPTPACLLVCRGTTGQRGCPTSGSGVLTSSGNCGVSQAELQAGCSCHNAVTVCPTPAPTLQGNPCDADPNSMACKKQCAQNGGNANCVGGGQ